MCASTVFLNIKAYFLDEKWGDLIGTAKKVTVQDKMSYQSKDNMFPSSSRVRLIQLDHRIKPWFY